MNRSKLLFVVNPISGTGKQKGIDKLIEIGIDAKKYDVDIAYTEYAGHASELAKEAVGKYSFLVVVGGDGTINEVVKELIDTDVTMGIIPCGSGNGLARHLGLPMNTRKAIISINTFVTKKIDTLTINNEKCVNVMGVGFDACISHEFAKMTKRGLVSYFKSVVYNYFSYKNQPYTIECKGDIHKLDAFLLTVANSSQYGNNAYISPFAKMNDGVVELVAIKKPNLLQVPALAIAIFTKRIHKSSLCTIIKGSRFTISQNHDFAHIDGEPLNLGTKLDIVVKPLSLNIIVNPNVEI